MTSVSPVQNEDNAKIVSNLIEISQLDTLYRDLYLQTARALMESILSYDAYIYIKDSLSSLDLVNRQLRAAVQRADWKRTTELSERVKTINRSAEQVGAITMGESVYDKLSDIPVDAFATGFYVFSGSSQEALEGLKRRAIDILYDLEFLDPAKKGFYSRRRADFEGLTIGEQKVTEKKKAASTVDLRQEALNAVDSGDLSMLESIVQKLNEKPSAETKDEESGAIAVGEADELGNDLNYSFSEETLSAAREMGMSLVRTRSRRHLDYLMPYGWSPSYLKSESKRWAKDQVSRLTHPGIGSNAAREAMELYLLNPLINSGGTRYQVCMVEEDLLLENFDEPEPGAEMPYSKLLEELGLSTRWGRTRIQLEEALLRNGPRILNELLHIDAEEFRLVAVPPDIFTLLGQDLGWGKHEYWTHFDGYWVREGCKLEALAGGDKRFGGTHDVVCFSPNYTSDKLLSRFAVVQRKRMKSWHRK